MISRLRVQTRVRVWDLAQRLLHWALVASVSLAALSAFTLPGAHQPAGYVALGAVGLRVAWGFAGSRYARFVQCVRNPRATLRYLRLLLAYREPRYLGHNPLGGWMVIALLGCVAGLAFTGWLYRTDAFWGNEAVENAHRMLAWALLAATVLHVSGVVFTSLRHRENLLTSMFSGSKRAPSGSDID